MEHMPHSSNLYPLIHNFYHINAFYVLYLDIVLMIFYVSKEKMGAVSRETLSLWKQQSQISLWPGWTQSIINFNGTTLNSWHYSDMFSPNTCEKHSLVVLKINTHVVSEVSFVLFSIQTAPVRAALTNFSTSFYQNEIRVLECSAEVPEPPTSSTATEFQALSDWMTLTAVHSGTFWPHIPLFPEHWTDGELNSNPLRLLQLRHFASPSSVKVRDYRQRSKMLGSVNMWVKRRPIATTGVRQLHSE